MFEPRASNLQELYDLSHVPNPHWSVFNFILSINLVAPVGGLHLRCSLELSSPLSPFSD
jgi:hypothetical protein